MAVKKDFVRVDSEFFRNLFYPAGREAVGRGVGFWHWKSCIPVIVDRYSDDGKIEGRVFILQILFFYPDNPD
jgi:hypothetical protein